MNQIQVGNEFQNYIPITIPYIYYIYNEGERVKWENEGNIRLSVEDWKEINE